MLDYKAPISLLVGLQGAWTSSEPADYALVRPPWSLRDDHRVIAFLPQNRHDCFTQAVKQPGSPSWVPTGADGDIDVLLDLADAELGVASS